MNTCWQDSNNPQLLKVYLKSQEGTAPKRVLRVLKKSRMKWEEEDTAQWKADNMTIFKKPRYFPFSNRVV